MTSAEAWGTTSLSEWARPPITTTTVGTPAAAVSSMSASCSAGRRRSLASRNSPDVSSSAHAAAAAHEDDRHVGAGEVVHDVEALCERGAGRRHRASDPSEVVGGDDVRDDLVGGDVDGAPGVGVVAVEDAACRPPTGRAPPRGAPSRSGRTPSLVSSTTDRVAARRARARSSAVSICSAAPGGDVPVVEEAERRLLLEHPAAGPVDDRLVHAARPAPGRGGWRSTRRTAAPRRHRPAAPAEPPPRRSAAMWWRSSRSSMREVVGDDARPRSRARRAAGR